MAAGGGQTGVCIDVLINDLPVNRNRAEWLDDKHGRDGRQAMMAMADLTNGHYNTRPESLQE